MLQYNKFLGPLFIRPKTTDRAQDMKDKITIKRDHLEQMMTQWPINNLMLSSQTSQHD